MKRIFFTSLVSAALLIGIVSTAVSPAVSAKTAKETVCEGSGGKWTQVPDSKPPVFNCNTDAANGSDLTATIKKVVNLLLFLIGVTAVIFIIIAAFRFVTANGDSNSVTSARNTILYAVVGLVVAVSAYAIVNFVVGQL